MNGKVLQFAAGRDAAKVHRTKRDKLIADNIGLVPPIARAVRKGLPPSFELDDLIQAGNIGLIEAAERFDEALGVPFGAYARRRIHGEILDSVRRRNYIESTHDAIEDHAYDLQDTTLMDAEMLVEQNQKVQAIDRAVAALPDRQRKVITMHYQQEQTLVTVGEELECHPSRASQLHTAALRKLRRELKVA